MEEIENLRFINANSEEIDLDNDCIVLLSKDGFSGLEAEFVITQYPEQYGGRVRKTNIEPKLVVLDFKLITSDLEEEQEQRCSIQRILNPLLGKGKLIYTNTHIQRETGAYVKIAPLFDDDDPIRPPGILSFQIVFYLDEPLWEDAKDTVIELREVVPQFEFILEIPDEGIEMSTLTEGEVELYNDGDAPAPLFFMFYGPAKNPKITLNDNQYIRIKDEVLSNERLYISTKGGEKKIEIYRSDGTIQNAWNRIDHKSTLFQLPIGKSIISFDADTGSDEATLEITFRKKYIGV